MFVLRANCNSTKWVWQFTFLNSHPLSLYFLIASLISALSDSEELCSLREILSKLKSKSINLYVESIVFIFSLCSSVFLLKFKLYPKHRRTLELQNALRTICNFVPLIVPDIFTSQGIPYTEIENHVRIIEMESPVEP